MLSLGELASTARTEQDSYVEIGLPIVRRLAFRLARRLPQSVDVADLISAGSEGLLKAAANYDPTVHPRFEPYAERRIRGAMLDELRAWDPVTRHGRRRMAEVTKAVKRLIAELGRQPDELEIAAELGVDVGEYRRLTMELARGPMLGGYGQIDPDDVDSGFADPCTLYSERELKQRLAEAIGKLSERMQTVLALYYQEECTQAEIGLVLGVTESRVCQILGEAATRLRALLSHQERVGSALRRIG